MGCTNVINTRILPHTSLYVTLPDNVSTLVLPNRISGQACDYTQLSEVVARWLSASAPQPPWQSYRKHNEAIRFGERSLQASRPTGWVPTEHVLTASTLLAARCDPRLAVVLPQPMQCILIGWLPEWLP